MVAAVFVSMTGIVLEGRSTVSRRNAAGRDQGACHSMPGRICCPAVVSVGHNSSELSHSRADTMRLCYYDEKDS